MILNHWARVVSAGMKRSRALYDHHSNQKRLSRRPKFAFHITPTPDHLQTLLLSPVESDEIHASWYRFWQSGLQNDHGMFFATTSPLYQNSGRFRFLNAMATVVVDWIVLGTWKLNLGVLVRWCRWGSTVSVRERVWTGLLVLDVGNWVKVVCWI